MRVAVHVAVHDIAHRSDDPRAALLYPFGDTFLKTVLVCAHKERRYDHFVSVERMGRVDDVYVIVAQRRVIFFKDRLTVIKILDERRDGKRIHRCRRIVQSNFAFNFCFC